MKTLSCLILSVCLLLACQKKEVPLTWNLRFTFDQSEEGWQPGFADYPEADRNIYELSAGHEALPNNLNAGSKALRISGTNRSDDLFMFWKREVTGLVPNQRYSLAFELDLASQYPRNSFGVGGSPGAGVFLKVGASVIEPQPVLDEGGYWRMNIDKSNQAASGEDLKTIGDIGIPGETFAYRIIQRSNADETFGVTTNATGKLWLIVGTDSGFESTTTLYYDRIRVKLTPE